MAHPRPQEPQRRPPPTTHDDDATTHKHSSIIECAEAPSSPTSSSSSPVRGCEQQPSLLVRLVFRHGLELSRAIGPVDAALLAPSALIQGLLEGQEGGFDLLVCLLD